MNLFWARTHAALCKEVGPRDAQRLTNYVFAGCVIATEGRKPIDALFLKNFVQEVSARLGQPCPDTSQWLDISQHARTLDFNLDENRFFDEWVEAFQQSGSERKSLGAFSTPAPFAEALAESLLRPVNVETINRIIDPACGPGGLLIAAYKHLVLRGTHPATAVKSLYGIELDEAARELCVLHVWLTVPVSMRPPIEEVSSRILIGNGLTHNWFESEERFDAVIMNPPWDSLRHKQSTTSGEEGRLETIARLSAKTSGAQGLPRLFTAQGKGDRNLFKAFVELAPHLLNEGGRISALIPAAFGSDFGMSELREFYLKYLSVEKWTTFENQKRYFPIDTRYKFGVLTAVRSAKGTSDFKSRSFCTEPNEISADHLTIHKYQMDVIGGQSKMFAELRSGSEEALLTKLLRGSPVVGAGDLGKVGYCREVDLTLGKLKRKFFHVDEVEKQNCRQGNLLSGLTTNEFAPLLEGRMVGQYDCFQKSYVSGFGRKAVWRDNDRQYAEDCRSQYVAPTDHRVRHRVAVCDVTSATNTRTVLAALVPNGWTCGNTAPVLSFETRERSLAALVVLNSFVFDWMARRLVSGLHLNKFYLETLRWPHLDKEKIGNLAALGERLCWRYPRSGDEAFAAVRSISSDNDERIALRATAEAYVAHLYNLERSDLELVLSQDKADRRGFWRYFKSSNSMKLRDEIFKRMEDKVFLSQAA